MIKKNRLFVLLAYLIMIGINALANIIPFNKMTTGEVSDAYPNLFAPAPITFGIWLVIYSLLLIYAFYQLGTKPEGHEKVKNRVAYFFILSSLLNSVWIVLWHYEKMAGTVLLMIGILISLIIINLYLHKTEMYGLEKWLMKTPFSIYFGWITVATIANVTTYLVSSGWDGAGLKDVYWTAIILLIGMIMIMLTALRFKDVFYGLVGIWAYAGIIIKHVTTFKGEYPLVIISATIGLLGIGFMLYKLIFKKKAIIE
ncbi:MAG: tryptophan-rich sensory protein [Clostridia bacterium]|nr:tryptophan-rich sensory protein [Clostridia bacterium]